MQLELRDGRWIATAVDDLSWVQTTQTKDHWLSSPPLILAASSSQYSRAAERIDAIRLLPPSARIRLPDPLLLHKCERSYVRKDDGLQRMALHAEAWRHIVKSNASAAIFEHNVAYASAEHASARLLDFVRRGGADDPKATPAQPVTGSSPPCDVALLGHCVGDEIAARARCTHAYAATPRAAALLLSLLEARKGCALPGELHRTLCGGLSGEKTLARPLRSDLCCSSARGNPGRMLYASGIIGQERSMPGLALHHDASCARSSISSVAASASASVASSSSSACSAAYSHTAIAFAARPMIIAFGDRFERAAAVVRSIGLFPPAERLQPAPPPLQCHTDTQSTGPASARVSLAGGGRGGGGGGGGGGRGGGGSRPQILSRGILSLAATHALAWERIVQSNVTAAVFEDDIAVDAARQKERESRQRRE